MKFWVIEMEIVKLSEEQMKNIQSEIDQNSKFVCFSEDFEEIKPNKYSNFDVKNTLSEWKQFASRYDVKIKNERFIISHTFAPSEFIFHHYIMNTILHYMGCTDIKIMTDSKYVDNFIIPRAYMEASGEMPENIKDTLKPFFDLEA